jgi:hypothetical protein
MDDEQQREKQKKEQKKEKEKEKEKEEEALKQGAQRPPGPVSPHHQPSAPSTRRTRTAS